MIYFTLYTILFSTAFVLACWSAGRRQHDRANMYFAITLLLFVAVLCTLNTGDVVQFIGIGTS
jgi:formate hydrogenlyase subunit 3/multisubunit Na+/H+ antiporter MnhD subunit